MVVAHGYGKRLHEGSANRLFRAIVNAVEESGVEGMVKWKRPDGKKLLPRRAVWQYQARLLFLSLLSLFLLLQSERVITLADASLPSLSAVPLAVPPSRRSSPAVLLPLGTLPLRHFSFFARSQSDTASRKFWRPVIEKSVREWKG